MSRISSVIQIISLHRLSVLFLETPAAAKRRKVICVLAFRARAFYLLLDKRSDLINDRSSFAVIRDIFIV
jgi:hypothetical protein